MMCNTLRTQQYQLAAKIRVVSGNIVTDCSCKSRARTRVFQTKAGLPFLCSYGNFLLTSQHTRALPAYTLLYVIMKLRHKGNEEARSTQHDAIVSKAGRVLL